MLLAENPFRQKLSDLGEEDSAIRIGRRIRKIREERNMTMTELAKNAGFSLDMLQKYEYGKRKPKKERLKNIASALGVSVYALSDPVLNNDIGIMYALFELDEILGLSLFDWNGKICMMFSEDSSNDLDEYLRKWYEKRNSISEQVSKADGFEVDELNHEYNEWTWNFPNTFSWGQTRKDIENEKAILEKRLNEINELLKESF